MGWVGEFRFRGEPMAYYRLYTMDGLGGHVMSVHEMEARTDADAIAAAEERRRNVAMELWCGRRKVKRWPGEPVKSSPRP